MMKFKLTILCVLLAGVMNAQSLTYAAYSAAHSAIANVQLADLSSFNQALPTITGTGVVWNASALTPLAGYPVIHLQNGIPSLTPNGSLFPQANSVQFDPALVAVLQYNYYNLSADSLVQVGEYSPSGAHEIYQNPDKRLIFPLNYGQSFSDTYAKTNYNTATTISSYQIGSRTVTFSGYGDLQLPQGTFHNVGMIAEVRTNSLGPNSTDFSWYDLSSGKLLLMASENAGDVTIGYTVDQAVGLVTADPKLKVNVAPNPLADKTTLFIPEQVAACRIRISDIIGAVVLDFSTTDHEVEVVRGNLKSGIYFFEVLSGDAAITSGKLILQ